MASNLIIILHSSTNNMAKYNTKWDLKCVRLSARTTIKKRIVFVYMAYSTNPDI